MMALGVNKADRRVILETNAVSCVADNNDVPGVVWMRTGIDNCLLSDSNV